METKKNGQILLVLVPHTDIRAELKKYFNSLVKNGLKQVYPFPFITPLAVLDETLEKSELTKIARILREIAVKNIEGKITSRKVSALEFDNKTLFGPELDLNILSGTYSSDKIIKTFSPLVIGTFITNEKKQEKTQGFLSSFDPPHLSFRAAATANMHWQPFLEQGETCYKWQIGKLTWLPKTAKIS
ncbi:MAG: hypothetical protein FWD28_03630 [Treponema sp.]|nr:hypothetical protein [Treponema sp.]